MPAKFEDEYREAAEILQAFYRAGVTFPRNQRWGDHAEHYGYLPYCLHISHIQPLIKEGRNDRCSCGSGKKFRKCCGV